VGFVAMDITLKERNLAIVLLDIIGSTRFVQRYGSLVAAKHFQIHDRLARSLIYKFDGREIDRSDGFLCSFDRTIDAVNFALTYQATIPKKTGLQTRIGIHWGKVVEVEQDEKYVAINAKKIELEGLAKNIAARTMSLCGPGQVLLTEEAKNNVRNRTNAFTPKATRYACVGLYKFKGVREPQTIFAVGETIQSLQPPKGSDKVKRLGGPRKIKSRARDRKILEWLAWLYFRIGIIAIIYLTVTLFIPIIISPTARQIFGLEWFSWVDPIVALIRRFLATWQ
jgi:class 3 adenylate cyclase